MASYNARANSFPGLVWHTKATDSPASALWAAPNPTIFPIIRSLKMTKRFPLVVFGIFILFGISVNTYVALKGFALSKNTGNLWMFTLSYIIAWGVDADRKMTRFSVPFDFSAFVFFAWPIVVPYYLFKTRGWGGLGWGIALLAAVILPDLVAVVVPL